MRDITNPIWAAVFGAVFAERLGKVTGTALRPVVDVCVQAAVEKADAAVEACERLGIK